MEPYIQVYDKTLDFLKFFEVLKMKKKYISKKHRNFNFFKIFVWLFLWDL